MSRAKKIELSNEQQLFIDMAVSGKNILVDACIGSGKTTAIQHFCNIVPESKNVLYLTYNNLLKLDAKSKIKNSNIDVTNYHSFSKNMLANCNIMVGVSDLIQKFIEVKPPIKNYDILIIDEYQDIETELATLLQIIKDRCPNLQIIAVGDMQQKIYDKTTLDVIAFINEFLDNYTRLEFTKCFRLSEVIATKLGRIWNKKIVGVNPDCAVQDMTVEEVTSFLAKENTSDILCLGAKYGDMVKVQNSLEKLYPEKFNKQTVYSSISEKSGAVKPKKTSAIFTTYDSSKGLERKICVVFDFTEDYWNMRINKPQTSYEILRNIFCVACSRGKNKIIIVKGDDKKLSESTLATYVAPNNKFTEFNMSSMFDFKYKEDVEKCFQQLIVKKITTNDNSIIAIKNHDALIDLSPCIGIYQEATFFSGYDIDKEITHYLKLNDMLYDYSWDKRKLTLDEKILYYMSKQTRQDRYRTQVNRPFVNDDQSEEIHTRLSTEFDIDENVQVSCNINFNENIKASGFADVVKDNIVYELKFVSELSHEHFLQCACYMIALRLSQGILWNTRDNTMYEIEIGNPNKFKQLVLYTITKHAVGNLT